MTRWTFAALIAVQAALVQAPEEATVETEEVAPGVYVLYGRGGNQGKAGENGVIRIGISANQKKTFIAGIRNVQIGLSTEKTVFLDANGQLGTIKSSGKFKENIQPMGSVSERLLALRPVTFQYKQSDDDGSKPVQFGLIAEEVAVTFPELAIYDEKGEPGFWCVGGGKVASKRPDGACDAASAPEPSYVPN